MAEIQEHIRCRHCSTGSHLFWIFYDKEKHLYYSLVMIFSGKKFIFECSKYNLVGQSSIANLLRTLRNLFLCMERNHSPKFLILVSFPGA